MPAPFREWIKPDEARKVLQERIERDLGDGENTGSGKLAYEANYLYVERGNSWQKGRMWPTQHPDPFIRDRRLAQVRPMFAPIGVLQSCATNQTDALLSREAKLDAVAVKPEGEDGKQSDGQVKRGKEGLAALSVWWDAVKLWDAVRLSATRAAWAARAPLRLRMLDTVFQTVTDDAGKTTRRLGEDGKPLLSEGLAFGDAISRIALETPEPQDALLHVDPETQEVCCIIAYKDENDQQAADVWYMDRDGEGRETAVRRIIRQDGTQEDRYPGGALPLTEVSGKLLIGDSERRGQAQIDYTNTKLTYLIQYASHPATFTIDAEPHGEWSPNPPANGPALDVKEERGVTWYLHPAQWDTGAEIVHELVSRIRETKHLEGGGVTGAPVAESVVTAASVQVIPPADPALLTAALDAEEGRLKRQMRQGHLVTLDKATSGEEKKQDRAGFEKQVGSYQISTELAVANILTTAGRIALLMTAPNDPMQGWFDEYAISCTLRIDTGPLSSEEVKEETELAEKGFKPHADVMMSAGRVDDVATAEAAIMAHPMQRLARIIKAFEAFEIIKNASNEQAAIQIIRETGVVSDDVLALMARGDFTGVTQ
jgi:hypothetical protein